MWGVLWRNGRSDCAAPRAAREANGFSWGFSKRVLGPRRSARRLSVGQARRRRCPGAAEPVSGPSGGIVRYRFLSGAPRPSPARSGGQFASDKARKIMETEPPIGSRAGAKQIPRATSGRGSDGVRSMSRPHIIGMRRVAHERHDRRGSYLGRRADIDEVNDLCEFGSKRIGYLDRLSWHRQVSVLRRGRR